MTNTETGTMPTRVLCVHTCGGLDHAAWVTIDASTPLPDGTIAHRGRCEGRTLTLIEGVSADLEPGWSAPCPCWDLSSPVPHEGHCCFAGDSCDHHDLMRACDEQLPIGDVPRYAWNAGAW